MDPFTQRMLERAEQRSKNLGITSTQKAPLSESNNDHHDSGLPPAIVKRQHSRQQSVSPQKKNTMTLTRNAPGGGGGASGRNWRDGGDGESKENCDVALEINITAGQHVQVQVEVEEREIDADGNIISRAIQQHTSEYSDVPSSDNNTPMIRDSSRNRLQRLGALYSDNENLSSPIHRNEARFDTAEVSNQIAEGSRVPNRSGKLAALANSINTWEDESVQPDLKHKSNEPAHNGRERSPTKRMAPAAPNNQPKVIGSSPRKNAPTSGQMNNTGAIPKKFTTETQVTLSSKNGSQSSTDPITKSVIRQTTDSTSEKLPGKQLKWDKNVMDSLEAQGFTRRESTTSKMVYDYGDGEKTTQTDQPNESQKPLASNAKVADPPKSLASIGKGLVSGRAALFESNQSGKPSSRVTQKDPADLSLKDRLALFEKNKGSALVPKAAFGMSASQKQISNQSASAADTAITRPREELQPRVNAPRPVSIVKAPALTEKPSIDAYNKPILAESHASGNCIRSTVAALMNKGNTISATEISSDVRKQREREMNILLNRFNRPVESASEPEPSTNETESCRYVRAEAVSGAMQPPPPPPPPPSAHNQQYVEPKCIVKRKSTERTDKQSVSPPKADAKRKKVTTNTAGNRLYPVLSDLESTTATESDPDNYTTATVTSSDEQHGYINRPVYRRQPGGAVDDYSFDGEDSYMDSEDADTSDDIANISLGREILQAVKRNDLDRPATRDNPYEPRHQLDSSATTGSEVSSANVTGDMDEYLDEALDEDDSDSQFTPKKGSVSSNSFSFARSPPKPPRQPAIPENDEDEDTEGAHYESKSINYRNPVKSELRVDPSEDNEMVTLTHTVSFYRRQQSASVSNTPIRKVTYADQRASNMEDMDSDEGADEDELSDDDETDNALGVEDKVKRLMDEIRKQEQIMSQTSQALNLCAATIEFSGSTESVEGERHLLVASHRRQAALNEVQRLRVERCLRAPNAPTDRGRMTIKEITVPLRQEYKDKLNTETICGHQLVCLLKYNENVVATKTVPTLPGLLAVKFPDVLTLNNVYADFKITLEIYGMTAQREVVPHDLKYHINRKTPKGKKGQESRLVMPPVQSPGGPGAVRTPALTHYGFVIFSLREIKRSNWTLNQASAVSPLQGTVYMKVNCELQINIDYTGFLTMFEDVAGFGAWHRRWCRLHGNVLSYWRYPDDEKTKAPMGSIDLKTCCTQKVTVAPREVCARLNTMLLEMRRPCQDDDKDSLVIVRHSKYTVVRHLLSADTKEEREKWCQYFNKALVLVRSWGTGSSV